MPAPQVWLAVAIEDGGVALMGRVVGNNAALINQATIDEITYKVYEKGDAVNIAVNSPLTVSNVVFDSLQTDARWTKDATGYNFRHDLVPAELPEGGKVYIVEFKFVPEVGSQFYGIYSVDTLSLIQS